MLEVRSSVGVAGAIQATATVAYPGEESSTVRFYGSSYGGPVLMRSGALTVWVDGSVSARCGGILSADWVRRFFAPVDGGAL